MHEVAVGAGVSTLGPAGTLGTAEPSAESGLEVELLGNIMKLVCRSRQSSPGGHLLVQPGGPSG